MSRPTVVTTCMIGSSESWLHQQQPYSWHSRAGGGAVHSINSGLSIGLSLSWFFIGRWVASRAGILGAAWPFVLRVRRRIPKCATNRRVGSDPPDFHAVGDTR